MAISLILMILLLIVESILFIYSSKALSPVHTTLLINQENAVILDLRPSTAFQQSHLPNAQHVNEKNLQYLLGTIPKQVPVIFITQQDKPSFAFLRTFRQAGLKKLYHLEGGMTAWQEQNLPLSNH